jgi:hypothetical protein
VALVAAEEVAHSAMAFVAASIGHHHSSTSSVHGERLSFSLLGRILFPVVHLLHKGFGFLLVHE